MSTPISLRTAPSFGFDLKTPPTSRAQVAEPSNISGITPILEKSQASSSAVQIRMLKTENEMLRSQMNSQSKREKELRSELSRKESELMEARRLIQSEKTISQEDSLFRNELVEAKAELSRLSRQSDATSQSLAMKREENHEAAKKLWDLKSGVRKCSEVLEKLATEMEHLQQKVLPGFKPVVESEIPPNSICHAYEINETNSNWLGSIVKFERAFRILEMVVDAKLESLTITKTKLQEENRDLELMLERALVRQGTIDRARSEQDTLLTTELESLKKTVEAEKSVLLDRIHQLESLLKECTETVSVLQSNLREAQEEVHFAQSKLQEYEAYVLSQNQEMARGQQSKATLVSELIEEKKKVDALKLEIENLKMMQKYFSRASNHPSNEVPKEKVDLVRTVNRLQTEVTKLRQENTMLTVQNQELQRLCQREEAYERFQSRLTDSLQLSKAQPTVSKVPTTPTAAQPESEADLAVQILRKNMQGRRLSRLLSSSEEETTASRW